MKKLLNIFGTMALITTASTSGIVFSTEALEQTPDEPTTAPEVNAPVTKINISNKNTYNTHIGIGKFTGLTQISATKFLTKLHEQLVEISGLKNIKTSDYVVYNEMTNTPIPTNANISLSTNSNVNWLKIKIVAKGDNFVGEKDITVHFII